MVKSRTFQSSFGGCDLTEHPYFVIRISFELPARIFEHVSSIKVISNLLYIRIYSNSRNKIVENLYLKITVKTDRLNLEVAKNVNVFIRFIRVTSNPDSKIRVNLYPKIIIKTQFNLKE
jgi:hypothetical protein